MTDKLTTKEKMAAARDFIQQGKYPQARAVLKTVNHPTAREWEKKLDGMDKPAKTKRSSRYTAQGCLMMLILFFGGLAVIFYAYNYFETQQRREEQRPEARAALSVYCNFTTNIGDYRCDQWADETLDEKPSLIEDVWWCQRLYESVLDLGFERCLTRNNIYLP